MNDQGEALPNGERGEIFIRKIFTFVEYYNNPKATLETRDKDGWIHMGDLGYFNDDGEFFIVDRIKSVMLYRNYWVSGTNLS